jgi:hypothetical protein
MSEYTIADYRNAPSGIGPLADQWRDKPHRLVYDLCHLLEQARAAAPEPIEPVDPEPIDLALMRGHLPQGYELQAGDVGRELCNDWGPVLPIDVGKRCYWRNDLFQIESREQRDQRKARESA